MIEPDGKVHVREIIATEFFEAKHGIYRDIPYEYQDGQGHKTYTNIVVNSVTENGSPAKKQISSIDGYIRIKIGDPNQTTTGKHSYILDYDAIGVLRSFTDFDELYWNATGNGWEVPIEQASVRVTIPKNTITQAVCYEGFTGSTAPCRTDATHSAKEATFASTGTLAASEGLTFALDYTKGTVPILTSTPPKRIETEIFTPASLLVLLLSLVGGIAGIVRLWVKRGRDFWFRAPSQLDPTAKPESKPVLAHETVTVEFEPPEKLRPAEIGVLMDEQADTLDVTATLIDLAQRGYIKITEIEKKWLFGSSDYTLEKMKEADAILLGYEKMFLSRLFSSGKSINMSDLKLTFYQDLAEIKKSLYQEVTSKKFFVGNPETTRQKYGALGGIVIAVGAVSIFGAVKLILGPLATCGAGVMISGIGILIASRFMPQRTALGHELWQRSKGYYEFISGAEKYRQRFFEKKNMFNDILAYAIVFKLTDKFAKAMADMGVETSQPGWYVGSRPFNTAYFVSSVNNFSSSMSRAIASTPSSSGSSGGSSGGGFGGGGGGSW